MKTCPTCGNTAEEQASFCPCCGTSFVVRSIAPPPPPPVAAPPRPAIIPPLFEEEKEKKQGGHALPIAIISVLATLTVTLAALWLSGGLEAMLGKETATTNTTAKEQQSPNIQSNALPEVAATYGNGEKLTTEQYLAYLYLTFENTYNAAYEYYNMYAQYIGTVVDPLTQTYTYGEEQLSFDDYVVRLTHDNIKNCIVLSQMMKDNNITWDAEDEAEFNEDMATLPEDAFIHLGFSNESYITAAKNLQLCWTSTFYGLYEPGGARGVSELELRQYFVQYYISYKMISIPLTDSNGKALDKNGESYKKLMDLMDGYMETYQKEGFEAAYAQYEKDSTTISDIKRNAVATTTTNGYASHSYSTQTITDDTDEHDLRQDVDASNPNYIDPALAEAILGKRGKDGEWEIEPIEVGDCQIIEVTSGEVTYAVMLERLDIDKDDEGRNNTLFVDSIDDILYEMHGATFTNEVEAAIQRLNITFDKTVVDQCKPEAFLEILENG